jgi:hypothetical protein
MMQTARSLGLFLLFAAAATGQEPGAMPAPAGPEQVDSGTVVNYEEGRNVVIRRDDGTQAIYPVASNLNWPPELKMYGWVNVYWVPVEGGGIRVTRLTTEPPTPTPVPATPTQPPPPTLPPAPPTPTPGPSRPVKKGAPVRLSMENAVTVVAIDREHSITVKDKDEVRRTYRLDASSELPPRLAVRQKVVIETKTVDGATFVKRVVYPDIVITNVPKPTPNRP